MTWRRTWLPAPPDYRRNLVEAAKAEVNATLNIYLYIYIYIYIYTYISIYIYIGGGGSGALGFPASKGSGTDRHYFEYGRRFKDNFACPI